MHVLLSSSVFVVNGSTCFDREVTIYAQSGVTRGTAGDDVILGSAGDDTIYGLDGDDFICDYGGYNVVGPPSGGPVVDGGSGNDVCTTAGASAIVSCETRL